MMPKTQSSNFTRYYCQPLGQSLDQPLAKPLYRVAIALMLGLAATTSMALPASAETTASVTSASKQSLQPSIADENTTGSSAEIRQDLVQIITSADYAESKTVESWQPIDKPASEKERELSWLGKLLKWLFGNQSDFGTAAFFSLLLKGLLVLALLAFIVWVAKRAGYLEGWLGTIQSRISRSSRVESYNPTLLAQNGQPLPAHEQIPTVIAAHLQQGELTAAASILYRGSLRWLMMSQQLTIVPAMTEKQCLAQIDQLNESAQHPYISGIIQLWVQAAYDSSSSFSSKSPDSAHYGANLAEQIREAATRWLDELPTSQKISTHTAEVTHAK